MDSKPQNSESDTESDPPQEPELDVSIYMSNPIFSYVILKRY